LPRQLPESSLPATQVLSGHIPAAVSALDLAGLARLLFFSAGVTRIQRGVLFRAAPSAGALYPTELLRAAMVRRRPSEGGRGGVAAGAR
jgi:hypothetical protein